MDTDESPLNGIADSEILSWCAGNPEARYALVANSMQPFYQKEGGNEIFWRPCAIQILEKAVGSDQMEAISSGFAEAMIPTSWSGSRADIIEKRAVVLYQQLFSHKNTAISAWASRQLERTQKILQQEREFELNHRRTREEAFE